MATTGFIIEPYVGAQPIQFGMAPSDVETVLGELPIKSRNFRKELVYNYEYFNVDFDKSDSVYHIGFVPGADVRYEGMPVFTERSFHHICLLDKNAKEVVGFVVLLNLGIAFTGFHDNDESQKSVSVFAKGTHDDLKAKMKDFMIDSA